MFASFILCSLSSIYLLISPTQSQQTPIISTDPSYYYNLCAPSTCNNFPIRYPFSLPTPCHVAGIDISCRNNKTLLLTTPTNSDIFRLLSINYTDSSTISIFVASDSLFTCGSHTSRPRYKNNGVGFKLPSTYTIGTHLNCTVPPPPAFIQGLQNASCLDCQGRDSYNFCYYSPAAKLMVPNCEVFEMFTLGGLFNASNVRNLREYLQSGFQLTFDRPMECRGCQASGGWCGANPVSGSLICFCPSSVHPLNCSDGMIEDISGWVTREPKGRSRRSNATVAAIIASTSLAVAGVIAAVFVVICVRKQKNRFHLNKETISNISIKRYSYYQLKKITNNFSSILGEGGFGIVYKGVIVQNGSELQVAVKVLKMSGQTAKLFMNEVVTVGSIHHQNVVLMLGYCVEDKTHALVYEFMENGCLDKFIRNGKLDGTGLSPTHVYNIAVEIGRGIQYLHNGCSKMILHCDIKPSNVLLDKKLSAKVADFGLAKMIDKDHSHFSLRVAQGTPGYAAPEMWLKTLGPLTEKSDVYSYGMLILEMVGRRKNNNAEAAHSSGFFLPEWLYNNMLKSEFHFSVRQKGCGVEIRNEEDDMLQRMCLLGLWCIQHIPSKRPSMNMVLQMLEGNVEIQVPPNPFPHSTITNQGSVTGNALV